MSKLSRKNKIFLGIIYFTAVMLMLFNIYSGYIKIEIKDWSRLLFFILITGITESITLCFNQISFSTTFAVTIASYVILGPFEALISMLGGFLIRVLKVEDNQYIHIFNVPFYGTIFNCSMFTITYLIANYTYIRFSSNIRDLQTTIIGIVLFSIVHLTINTWIVAMYIAIQINKNPWYCFWSNIKMAVLNHAVMIPFGIILAVAFYGYSYWGIIIILFPILLVKYTFTYYAEAQSQFIQTVETLMNAMEARDKYTQGHSHRVAEIAVILGKELGFNQWKVEKLRIAAMLHDVGKMGISDNILNKPGKLTDEEFNIIKSHPTIGAGIIKDIKNLQYVVPIVKHHHERYDGKGYPEGKSGEELDIGVYIIQLADTIDAMASDRPYRKGLPKKVIIEEVNKYLGTQFHPKVAAAYLKIAQTSQELDQIWESE